MNEEDDLLAAELAFGLLPDNERQIAEARALADPAFAAAVARWQAYAAAMAAGFGEAPRPSLWPAIAARLPANDRVTTAPPALAWWRAGAIAAALLAGVMTIVAVRERVAPPPAPVSVPVVRVPAQPPLVAMLTGTSRGVIAVSFDPAQHRLTVAATDFSAGSHAPELWVIPADKKPRSLGVIDPTLPVSRPVAGSVAAAIAPGATLAISIEPIGGSPSGQPTGPIVASGTVQKS